MVTPLAPNLAKAALGAGIQTDFGILLPPGARVAAYVNSNGGAQDGDEFNKDYGQRVVTTLNKALSYCRSGRGDYVVVMPDHAEDISSADQMSSLVAGTTILGLGSNAFRPTFTWTAAAASFLLDVANVRIVNCILKMADAGNGGVTVIAPVTVSAAGCSIEDTRIFFGADADDDVTNAITTTAAADDFLLDNVEAFAATAAECVSFLKLVGADRFRWVNTRVVGATTVAAAGLVLFVTTASTDVLFSGGLIRNNKALSEKAITGMAGISGEVNNLQMAVLDNAEVVGIGTLASLVIGRQTTVSNVVAERGILAGTESA